MEPTDLMIGDWVYNSYHRKSIKWDYSEMFCQNGTLVNGKDLKPIPLTPEILEKNGFKFKNDSEISISSEKLFPDCTYVYIRFHKVEKWSIHISYRGMEELELRIYIRYVHILQHAFRLCGLNYLADNFKL